MRRATASMSLRLVVLFGLLALVLFTAVGSYLSHSLHMQLEARDDEELAGKCRSINHLVEHAASLEDILARRHLVLDTLSGHDQLLVRIARADGSTLLESHDPTRTSPDMDLSTVKIRSWDHIEALRMGDLRARYIASMPVTRSGEKAIVLVVRTASDRMLLLADYRADVWWAAAIGTVLATLLSYFLVRSGLRPLRMMAAQTRAISANKLDTRLDLQAAPRELHEIVQSFNDMLDRLHRSFQQLSQFSADLAHDVRTPLNNLMVQTQVALGKPRSLDEYQALLSSNIEEYERLSRMMESMLFLARADNAHVVLQIQPLDVAEELNRIADYFEGIAEEAQVRIEPGGSGVDLDPTFVECAADSIVVLSGEEPQRVLQQDVANHAPFLEILDQIAEQPRASVIFLVRDDGLETYFEARRVARSRYARNGKLPVLGHGKIDLSLFKQ